MAWFGITLRSGVFFAWGRMFAPARDSENKERAMNRIFLTTTSLMLLAGAAQAADPLPPAIKKAFDQYVVYFKDEGYKAEITKEGYLKLRVEGKDYYIHPFHSEPRYFYLSLGYNIAPDAKRESLLRAANTANYAFSIPKVALSDNTI